MKDHHQDFSMTIPPCDGHEHSRKKKELIEKHIRRVQQNRTPERRLRNEVLCQQYLAQSVNGSAE